MINHLKKHATKHTFERGDHITTDLALSSSMYYVESGAVIVESVSDHPEAVKQLGVLKTPGSYIGLEYLFLSGGRYQAEVKALTACEVWSISTTRLASLLKGELEPYREEIHIKLVESLSADYVGILQQASAAVGDPPEDLVLKTLIRLGDVIGVKREAGVSISVSLDTLASLTGLSYKTTQRATSLLMQRTYVARVGRDYLLIS